MLEMKCKHCGRYLGKAEAIVGNLICPTCGGTTNFKILTDKSLIAYKFIEEEKQPRKKVVKDETN